MAVFLFIFSEPDAITLRLGDHLLNDNTDDIVAPISMIKVHPSYNDVTLDHDIGLMKLEECVEYTDTISPVCLPAYPFIAPFEFNDTSFESNCVVTGWGLLVEGGERLSKINL